MIPLPMLKTLIFAITLALSAFILFITESNIGKYVLPHAGGGPLVWNTCLVFFQITLLLAYLSVHCARKLSLNYQVLIFFTLFTCIYFIPSFLSNPVTFNNLALTNPELWLWTWLIINVGFTFFVMATLSPLLQSWFAKDSTKADPYWLFSASNFGSFLALLTYPFFFERYFSLTEQNYLIYIGMMLLVIFVVSCYLVTNKNQKSLAVEKEVKQSSTTNPLEVCKWITLSAMPSAVLLSITNHLLTEISAIPLLWIIPLLIYLITFVVAFSKVRIISEDDLGRISSFLVLLLVLLFITETNQPTTIVAVLHLITFFLSALYCHTKLANIRPTQPGLLTNYYLWIAFGGVVGSLFTLMIAPLLFSRYVEYPLVLILILLFRKGSERVNIKSVGVLLIVLLLPYISDKLFFYYLASNFDDLRIWVVVLPVAIIVLHSIEHRKNYVMRLLALLSVSFYLPSGLGQTILVERNFYGVSRIVKNQDLVQIVHGTTIHGAQKISEMNECIPLSYYHKTGPVGDLFPLEDSAGLANKVLVIGLGIGSMACYAKPQEFWQFLELNPAMEKIANDTRFFTYLKNSANQNIKITIGDGRKLLEHDKQGPYNLIVVDVFSSDMIPTHLLTKEAIQLYLNNLTNDGLILLHLSNRYFNLVPVVSKLASEFGLIFKFRSDIRFDDKLKEYSGKSPSLWAITTRSEDNFDRVKNIQYWVKSELSNLRIWTDDYSDPLATLE